MKKVYDDGDYEIFQTLTGYRLRYDTGDLAGTVREDSISRSEAEAIIEDSAAASAIVMDIKRRLGW